MNFDFSDAQKLLKNQARDFLKGSCPTTVPRRILDGDEPYAEEVWKGLVDLEFTGISIPEEYGGIGFGYLELCCVAEELGRAVAPVPFSSSIYLATEALLAESRPRSGVKGSRGSPGAARARRGVPRRASPRPPRRRRPDRRPAPRAG